jgi:hypothetical protein
VVKLLAAAEATEVLAAFFGRHLDVWHVRNFKSGAAARGISAPPMFEIS